MSAPRPLPRFLARPLRFFAAVFFLAFLAAVSARGLARLRAEGAVPWSGASWIWAPDVLALGQPFAFYAVRDLEVAAPPTTARLTIVADEAYVVSINGQRIGGGRYRPGAPADSYEVASLLHAGRNRIVVELRSSRGAGGFLASLHGEGGGEPLLITDEQWRIFRRHDPALLSGDASLEEGEPAALWGRPPAGRWRLGSGIESRPVVPSARDSTAWQLPFRMRSAEAEGYWTRYRPYRKRLPELGAKALYDWGEEVTGYLVIDLQDVVVDTAATGTALLYLGREQPNFRTRGADLLMIPVPGAELWQAAQPRRFRYLLSIGAELHAAPYLLPVDASIAPQLLSRDGDEVAGVFGLAPLRHRSRADEMVWRRIRRKP